MPGKSERQQAQEVVAAYHETALGELLTHVASVIDDFRNGDINAFEVDRALFQYARAAKELWKFCNMTGIEVAAGLIRDVPRSTGGSAERPDAERTPCAFRSCRFWYGRLQGG